MSDLEPRVMDRLEWDRFLDMLKNGEARLEIVYSTWDEEKRIKYVTMVINDRKPDIVKFFDPVSFQASQNDV